MCWQKKVEWLEMFGCFRRRSGGHAQLPKPPPTKMNQYTIESGKIDANQSGFQIQL
jgi:hypothetical protein